ncbi:hypothetical protein [Streptomyces sp. NPDC047097]|uniref:hypothetical protein n=1 Tax=Streptomyces sp. NPDC047097 TaxID=3155260 RepID=UPI003403C9EC
MPDPTTREETTMADDGTVKMRLLFWRTVDGETKAPGDTIEIPADEVHRWKGFAEPAGDAPKDAGEKNPTTGSQQQKAAGK